MNKFVLLQKGDEHKQVNYRQSQDSSGSWSPSVSVMPASNILTHSSGIPEVSGRLIVWRRSYGKRRSSADKVLQSMAVLRLNSTLQSRRVSDFYQTSCRFCFNLPSADPAVTWINLYVHRVETYWGFNESALRKSGKNFHRSAVSQAGHT